MEKIHNFTLDHHLFQGWSLDIDILPYENLGEITEYFKNSLVEHFEEYELCSLRNKAHALNLQIQNIDTIFNLLQYNGKGNFIINEYIIN